MYLEHYGLAEAPFRITPHTDFFFSGANRGATLEALLYAITHDEGIVKISGEVGTGKTMLCRVLMERLPESVAIIYLANPSLSREDILYTLADELGIEVAENSRASAVMRALQEALVGLYSEGRQVVVLIDEAHAMPMETLEEIRLLSNLESNRHKLLQLVLFGQPELDETLARVDMRQLRDRITHNFSLEPLIRDDIAQYLDFRMRAAGYKGPNVFAPEAVRLIARSSAGLTRRINILADKSLLASFAAGTHQVGVKEAKAAIGDSDFSRPRAILAGMPPARSLIWAAGGAVVMLALIGMWRLNGQAPAPAAVLAPSGQPSFAQGQPGTATSNGAQTAATETAAKPSATPLIDSLMMPPPSAEDTSGRKRWFIQLYTLNDSNRLEHVEAFLEKALSTGLDADQLRVYHVQIAGKDRYGVIYGDYPSRKDAVRILADLPEKLKQTRPYARQASSLRPDNNTKPAN